MIKESIDFAVDSIKHRRVRAFLTVLGIVIGVAAIVALISLGNGLENAIAEEFSKMGKDVISIVPKGLRGPPTGSQGLNVDDVGVAEKVNGVEYVSPSLWKSAKLEVGMEEVFGQVVCYESGRIEELFEDTGNEVENGRLFSKGESRNVVLQNGLAKDGFNKELMVKSSILINEEKFRVIGVMKSSGSTSENNVIMSLEDCRELFDEKRAVSSITVKVMNGFKPESVADDIHDKLERYRDDENFEVYTSAQLLGQVSSMLGIVSAILSSIAAISLVVGGMGIMNSMYTNVLERTREIGVMKAVGAKNNQIMMVFLVEAGFYGLVGGFGGVILGVGVSKVVEVIASQLLGFGLLKIKVDLTVVGGVLLFSFLVGCLSGFLPSRRAAKMKPVDALRYE
jgi:putative ABC transport system permease protein